MQAQQDPCAVPTRQLQPWAREAGCRGDAGFSAYEARDDGAVVAAWRRRQSRSAVSQQCWPSNCSLTGRRWGWLCGQGRCDDMDGRHAPRCLGTRAQPRPAALPSDTSHRSSYCRCHNCGSSTCGSSLAWTVGDVPGQRSCRIAGLDIAAAAAAVSRRSASGPPLCKAFAISCSQWRQPGGAALRQGLAAGQRRQPRCAAAGLLRVGRAAAALGHRLASLQVGSSQPRAPALAQHDRREPCAAAHERLASGVAAPWRQGRSRRAQRTARGPRGSQARDSCGCKLASGAGCCARSRRRRPCGRECRGAPAPQGRKPRRAAARCRRLTARGVAILRIRLGLGGGR
jgi:hypothetical protein